MSKNFNFIEIEENGLMDFQFAILDVMKAKGISQAKFAEMLGVSRARVSQLLSAEANPTLKLVARALSVLEMKAGYELERKRSEAPAARRAGAELPASGFALMARRASQGRRAWGISEVCANENYEDYYAREAA